MNNEEFVIINNELTKYNGDALVVSVPDGVKKISPSAFLGNNNLEVVYLPEGLEEIAKYAFYCCHSLRKIYFPSTLKRLGNTVFFNCDSLREITLPEGIFEIPPKCFESSGLEKVVLPASLKRIGESAFQNCTELKEVVIPDISKVQLESEAFTNCYGLIDDSGFLVISNILFAYDKDIKVVKIPDGVKVISSVFFPRDTKEIHFPSSLVSVNSHSIFCGMIYIDEDSPILDYFTESGVVGFGEGIVNLKDRRGNVVARLPIAIHGENATASIRMRRSICSNLGEVEFARYDKAFSSIRRPYNKAKIAAYRIAYEYKVSPYMRKAFWDYVKKQSFEVGKVLVDSEDFETLSILGDKKIFSQIAIQKLVNYAVTIGNKPDYVSWFLKYQQENFQKAESGLDNLLDDKFSLEKQPKKHSSPRIKNFEGFIKPIPGSDLIGRYMGTKDKIEFPTEYADVQIKGIADSYWKTPENYQNIKSVTIPEGYETLGRYCFSNCKELTRIILPKTLREVGNRCFSGLKLKELVLFDTCYFGKDAFLDTQIDTVIYKSSGETVVKNLFFGCKIKNLIIVSDAFLSSDYVFSNTSLPNEYDECLKKISEINFPESIYTNHEIKIKDFEGLGAMNLRRIRPLSEFKGEIENESFRSLISYQSETDEVMLPNYEETIIKPEVAGKDFSFENKNIMFYGFPRDERMNLFGLYHEMVSLAIRIDETTDFVVVPDYEVANKDIIYSLNFQRSYKHDVPVVCYSEFKRIIAKEN